MLKVWCLMSDSLVLFIRVYNSLFGLWTFRVWAALPTLIIVNLHEMICISGNCVCVLIITFFLCKVIFYLSLKYTKQTSFLVFNATVCFQINGCGSVECSVIVTNYYINRIGNSQIVLNSKEWQKISALGIGTLSVQAINRSVMYFH